MDYKEIKKKNGDRIVFCNLEELLLESTGLKTIEEVRANIQQTEKEYICHCPFCKAEGHTKHKLYITKDLQVGFCFVCGRSWVNVDETLKVDYQPPSFIQNFYKTTQITLPTLTDARWNLENWKYDFEDSDEVGEKYLAGRHKYLPEIAKLLEFKYNNGNIVIPFRYKGEVAYYQIRFSGKSKIKYFFPPVAQGQKMPYILDFEQGKRRLVVCEGVFDAIALMIMAPDYIPIAVLGSSISDYQINFLREYVPEEILIYMDETSISKKIAKKIKSTIDYCPIHIIPSDGEDPEENLKSRINRGKDLMWIYPRKDIKPTNNGFNVPINNYNKMNGYSRI